MVFRIGQMVKRWRDLREAAELLGVSVRTVRRRLAAGEIEGRLAEDGRREVLIESPATAGDVLQDSLEVLAGRGRPDSPKGQSPESR